MSENFCSFKFYISFKKPNHVTKNAVLCVEERHALADKRGGGFDIFISCKNKVWHFFVVCTS